MPDLQINQMLDMQERGLHYGDGLFETLLKLNADIPLWSSHYHRLLHTRALWGISVSMDAWT